jgi:hypothetical protein
MKQCTVKIGDAGTFRRTEGEPLRDLPDVYAEKRLSARRGTVTVGGQRWGAQGLMRWEATDAVSMHDVMGTCRHC